MPEVKIEQIVIKLNELEELKLSWEAAKELHEALGTIFAKPVVSYTWPDYRPYRFREPLAWPLVQQYWTTSSSIPEGDDPLTITMEAK